MGTMLAAHAGSIEGNARTIGRIMTTHYSGNDAVNMAAIRVDRCGMVWSLKSGFNSIVFSNIAK
jgi:hypothetical protein